MEKKEKRYWSVKELLAELDGAVSRGTIYRMIHTGAIPTRRIRSRILIPNDWVQGFLDQPCYLEKPSRREAV